MGKKLTISLSGRSEAWTTINVPSGDQSADVRVRYYLLTESQIRKLRRAPLERYASNSDGGQVDALIEALSDEAAEERKQLLVERVLDWDIIDADTGKPLPISEETIRAVCDSAPVFVALYDGLLDASSAPVKKT